jgi:bifunctional non-homologous end joining protein LigD
MTDIKIGTHTIELTHSDKLLFPADALHPRDITKGELIDYYLRIADTMLPYLRDRPLSMERYPEGIGGERFIQKDVPEYFPPWIERIEVAKKTGGEITQMLCNNPATLVYLANQDCITPHPWLSRKDALDYPDKLVFDLDPPGEFTPVRQGAGHIHDLLVELGLTAYLMSTGSRGVHIVVPLDRSADFDAVRSFAHKLADTIADRHPDLFTVEPHKDKREGRIFIDIMRNGYGQTSVAPYAVRGRPGAPIAVPWEWSELPNEKISPQSYNVHNIWQRLKQKGDLWKGFREHKQSLKNVRI